MKKNTGDEFWDAFVSAFVSAFAFGVAGLIVLWLVGLMFGG